MHQAIFETGSMFYLNYPNLRKLRDYYSDAVFKGDEIFQLAEELKRYKEYIRKEQHNKVDKLIRKLLNFDVAEVNFYAD